MSTPDRAATVLFVDDDPDHLRIYGWLLEQAGYVSVPCLASQRGVEFPETADVNLVVLDYNLNCNLPTLEVAQALLGRYPGVPIVLLSNVDGLPPEMESYVTVFVRKGEPAKLTSVVRRLLAAQQVSDRPN